MLDKHINTLDNKFIVKFGFAPIEKAISVNDKFIYLLSQIKSDLKLNTEINSINITDLINFISTFLSDKEFRELILLNLCPYCLFNDEKITLELFNNVDLRKYFYEVLFIICKENLIVFIPDLKNINSWGQLIQKMKTNLK